MSTVTFLASASIAVLATAAATATREVAQPPSPEPH